MKITNNILRLALAVVLTSLTFCSCKKFQGDVTVPAYLHLDRIIVTPQENHAPSLEPGFYNSDIDAVEIVCYFEGDESETSLGTYQLPCTLPILHNGPVKYITLNPIVRQNGQYGTRIYYTYYQPIKLTDVSVSTNDTTCLGTPDLATGQWTLETHYYTTELITILSEDFFEPTSFATHFDSIVTWVTNDPANACTGQGYGLVHLADSDATKTFAIKDEFSPLPSNLFYLEMNYKTDFELYVNMIGYISQGSNASSKSILALRPTTEWKKIYINLGRTWSQFYHNVPLAIVFQAANPEGKEGNIYLDNVKIITR